MVGGGESSGRDEKSRSGDELEGPEDRGRNGEDGGRFRICRCRSIAALSDRIGRDGTFGWAGGNAKVDGADELEASCEISGDPFDGDEASEEFELLVVLLDWSMEGMY